MKLLKSLLVTESKMKDAAYDLIDRAIKACKGTSDIVQIIGKVLELDKDNLFKGDFKAVEQMVKDQLDLGSDDIDPVQESLGDEKHLKAIRDAVK